MREQLRVLVDHADSAVVLGHEDVLFGVDQHAVVEDDHAAVGAQQAGNQGDRDRLAGAGTAEQGYPGRTLERDLVGERAELDGGVETDHSN